jgi:hypothetical protein
MRVPANHDDAYRRMGVGRSRPCTGLALPVVVITSPADPTDVGNASTVQVTFTVNDNHDVTAGELLGPDGVAQPATRTTPAGTLPAVFTGQVTLVRSGENVIFAVGTDPAGNRGTDSVNVITDLVPPQATLVWPANGSTVGTATITLQVSFSESASVVSTNLPGLSGSVTPGTRGFPVTLTTGSNSFQVTLRDAAGNQATSAFAVLLGAKLKLELVSGDGQVGLGTELTAAAAEPLVVRVSQLNGTVWQARDGVSVDFDGPFVATPGAAPQVLTVTTAGGGLATTAGAELRFLPGLLQVRAHPSGAERPAVDFDLFGAADFDPSTPEVLDPITTLGRAPS